MICTPEWTRPHINTVYPPFNYKPFEEWFYENYEGDITEREYLPIFYCSYQVNNNYGQDVAAMRRLQDYLDSLPIDKKYWTISQYDDGAGVDWKGKDVFEFNMSKTGGNMYPLPLIGQPMPYKISSEKKYLANFIGNITHPIREHAKTLIDKKEFYISFEKHDPYRYCKIISESVFTLCYRGYGINSFRIAESLQYGSIPVYISDEFILPHNHNFNQYGLLFPESRLSDLEELLHERLHFENKMREFERMFCFNELYTYEGTKNKILKYLLTLK